MNIWGLQQQIKRINISKKKHLKRTKRKQNPRILKALDNAMTTRREKIKELRKNKKQKR